MSTVTTAAGRVPMLEAEIERLRDEHAAALALVADRTRVPAREEMAA